MRRFDGHTSPLQNQSLAGRTRYRRAIRSGSDTGPRSARCVEKIQSDQASSSFLGAGGILNSINCDATGSLPIEASTDLVLLCVNSGTCPGTVACSGSFVIPFQSMKAYSFCRLSVYRLTRIL